MESSTARAHQTLPTLTPGVSTGQQTRTPYSDCPLCESTELVDLRDADASRHPAWSQGLPARIDWRGCGNCGHVFTSGYFDGEALTLLQSKSRGGSSTPSELATARYSASRIVERVSQLRGSIEGRWLDVACGSGSVLTTAAEYGYEATGIDLCEDSVSALAELGYDARLADLGTLDEGSRGGGFDIISFDGVLARSPFPGLDLERARTLLQPGGVVFVSLPNVDTHVWRAMDAKDANPWWSELENYHAFSREHLYWCLRRAGFQPCHYAISARFRSGMEVCAWRTEDLLAHEQD